MGQPTSIVESAGIMYGIVYAIKETPEWTQATQDTPMLTEERKRLNEIIDRLPEELQEELGVAIANVEEAYADMALLYGMRVAGAIRESVNDPMIFSRYALGL